MRKAFRASKRLIKAIAGLAVSLVVCVGMCLAWFTMNDKVDSSGASVQIEDADFVCDVKVYYLNSCYDEDEVLLEGVYEKAEDGNVYGTGKNDKLEGDKAVDKPADGELSSASDKMRPYGSVENFATAVLYEVTYTIKRDSGTYRIVATCDSDTVSVTRKPDAVDVFDSDLSNVVGYYQAGADSGAANRFKRSEENSDIMFYKADNTKVQKLTLEGGIEYNGGKQVVSYFIMDYMDFPFVQLSNEMVQHQGTLNSRLDFAGDLHIVFERDDGEYPTFGHKHEYQYDSVGALQHKKYCACGLYETYENHTFAEGSDECTYCHYKSEHVHKFEQNKYSYNGDDTHSLQCDLCDFKQDTKISCEYTYKADGDDLTHHIKSCSACGHSENEAHTLTYTDTNDGTHHTVGCDKCDLNVSQEHSPSNDSCDKCGRGKVVRIEQNITVDNYAGITDFTVITDGEKMKTENSYFVFGGGGAYIKITFKNLKAGQTIKLLPIGYCTTDNTGLQISTTSTNVTIKTSSVTLYDKNKNDVTPSTSLEATVNNDGEVVIVLERSAAHNLYIKEVQVTVT